MDPVNRSSDPDPGVAPVARITVRGGREGERGILAVWPDGRVVWSGDAVEGGPPYYESVVDVSGALELPRRLKGEGVVPGAEMSYYGPSARWTHLELFDDGREFLDLRSWHEIREANPEVVATAGGVEPLGDRRREDVLATQPDDYRHFRALWDRVRSSLLALLPEDDATLARDDPWPRSDPGP